MKSLSSGKLKQSKEKYEVRRLSIENIAEIMNLQNNVYQKLIDKSKLERLSEDEFTFILSGNGLMIGAYLDDKLIAVRALLDPTDDPHHLGLAIGLEEKDLDKVIYQEVSFVNPDYQGNSLQKIMGNLIMKELNKKDHPYLYVCATVAPDNIPSLKDKFAQQMEIKALVTIYGEKKRYVFAKELRDRGSNKDVIKEVKVNLANVNEVKQYLDLHWVGTLLEQRVNEYFIKFVQYKS